MSKVFLDVSISIDGFIAHADNDPGALHEWIFTVPGEGFSPQGVNKAVFDELSGVRSDPSSAGDRAVPKHQLHLRH